MGRRPRWVAAALGLAAALAACGSCDRGRPTGPAVPGGGGAPAIRPAPAEFHPGPDFRPAAGQTVYVPVYSQVPIGERGQPFDLSVNLSVRNTDRARPIVLMAVRYYDRDGRAVRDFLKTPVRLAPMAAADYFLRERDASGGTSASFLVEWAAEQPVSAPVVEAVMVGTAGNQGVSFTTSGRVVDDRPR